MNTIAIIFTSGIVCSLAYTCVNLVRGIRASLDKEAPASN